MKELISFIFILIGTAGSAQIGGFTMQDADSLIFKSDKNVMVFISAPWCKICNLMKESCLKDPEVVETISESVNFIDFNSETKDSILLNGRLFKYISNGSSGKNELALELGIIDNKFSLPVTVFLNNKAEIIFQKSGLIQASELKKILSTIK